MPKKYRNSFLNELCWYCLHANSDRERHSSRDLGTEEVDVSRKHLDHNGGKDKRKMKEVNSIAIAMMCLRISLE